MYIKTKTIKYKTISERDNILSELLRKGWIPIHFEDRISYGEMESEVIFKVTDA